MLGTTVGISGETIALLPNSRHALRFEQVQEVAVRLSRKKKNRLARFAVQTCVVSKLPDCEAYSLTVTVGFRLDDHTHGRVIEIASYRSRPVGRFESNC